MRHGNWENQMREDIQRLEETVSRLSIRITDLEKAGTSDRFIDITLTREGAKSIIGALQMSVESWSAHNVEEDAVCQCISTIGQINMLLQKKKNP